MPPLLPRRRWSLVLAPALLACLCLSAAAQSTPTAFVHARILPISGPPIEEGTLVVHKGQIVQVTQGAAALPPGTEVIEARGKVIMPGLVCTHSHIGSPAAADRSAPIQPEVRVLDSIDIRHPSLSKARAGGLTTVNIMPGSGHLVSGQTIYLKLRKGRVIDDLLIRDAEGKSLGGLKMANGTNSRRDPPFPGTRGKSAALVRERFLAAQEYKAKVAKAGSDPEKLPARDLALETLVEVLDGKRVVHHHTHRHDDIMTVLRLRQEFGFKVVLHHVSDAWAVAPEIAAAGAACSLIVLDSPGGKLEARDINLSNGAVLEAAGALVGFHTDDPVIDSRLFRRSAALAVRGGMSKEGALRALTINGARILDLDKRTGSLEPGKDADFILLDGDPLSVYSHVLETWVDGVRVFNLADPADKLWSVGGFGAGNPRPEPLCCFETLEINR